MLSELVRERLVELGGSARSKPASSRNGGVSWGAPFHFAFQRSSHLCSSVKGAVEATFFVVLEALSELAVDESLGGEGDLALLDFGFKDVAQANAGLSTHLAGQGDLVFGFDFDDGHGSVC